MTVYDYDETACETCGSETDGFGECVVCEEDYGVAECLCDAPCACMSDRYGVNECGACK